MLITDQVATAPCTDPVQAHFLTFRAKQRDAQDCTHKGLFGQSQFKL